VVKLPHNDQSARVNFLAIPA